MPANFKEAPGYIDTEEALSAYYGPNSLACSGIRRLDETHVESYFIVPENLCGPLARPPMFDRLRFHDDKVWVQTDDNDAKEHFIGSVVINNTLIRIIPGHNLAGLAIEAAVQAYNRNRENPADLMLTEFGFIRYRGFVLPCQELVLTGAMLVNEKSISFSPDIMVAGQSKVKGNKFRLEVVDPLEKDLKSHMLAQHWLLETTAQGFGSAVNPPKGMVPVLMQSERSQFGKTPIVTGDLITTRLELLPSPSDQGFGNAEIFVNNIPYGTLRRLMVQFFPIEKIAEGIEAARSIKLL